MNYNMTAAGASGDFDFSGGVITVDMSGFQVNWNGTDFDYSNSIASGTVDANGNYSISFTSLFISGPLRGNAATYQFQGVVSAVPMPPSVWLLILGLTGLVGVARHNKP